MFQQFLFSYGWIIFHFMDIPQVIYSVMDIWLFLEILYFSQGLQCYIFTNWAHIFLFLYFLKVCSIICQDNVVLTCNMVKNTHGAIGHSYMSRDMSFYPFLFNFMILFINFDISRLIYFLNLYVWVFFPHVYCAPCIHSAHKGQKRVFDTMEMKLQITVKKSLCASWEGQLVLLIPEVFF